MDYQIRCLKPEEIECRVGTISEKGLSLLLYKNARADMILLDETFGVMNWQRRHIVMNGAVYCTISLRTEAGEWIEKQDVGTESFAEPVKGAVSDSFKRAAVTVGIGRELYTAPFIWIPADKVSITKDGQRLVTKDSFSVNHIAYDERKYITELTIENRKGQVVFSYKKEAQKETLTELQKNRLYKEMIRTKVSEAEIRERYQLESLETMSTTTFYKVMNALEKTKQRVA